VQNNVGVAFGTSLWRTDYAERVAQIMDEVTTAGARLMWVGMPIMQSSGFSADMEQLNAVYAQQAAEHPGVTYYSSWKLFATPSGQYSTYLNYQGQEIDARDTDGIHLAPAGWDMLGTVIVGPMQSAWHVKLQP
jgi:hypothetical protein